MSYGNIYRVPPQPHQLPLKVAPLTLVYGDQPPRTNVALAMGIILSCWPTGLEHQPQQKPLKVAPLIPAVVPEQPAYTRQPPAILQAWWDPQGRVNLWQGTLTEANPPDLPPFVSWQIVQVDEPPWPQQRRTTTPIVSAAVEQPVYGRLPESIRQAWEPAEESRQRRAQIAPLTLVYGDQPPRLQRQSQQAEAEAVPQQRRVTFPQVVVAEQPAFTRLSQSVFDSWQPAPEAVQRRTQIAPLTLTYGDQPPRRSEVVLNTILAAWIPPYHYDWRRGPFVPPPPIVTEPPGHSDALLLSIIARAWEPPPPLPKVKPPIAPLTLTYGNQPPRLRRQAQPPEAEPQPQQRRVTFPQVAVVEQPAYKTLPESIRQSWEPLPDTRQKLVKIAPLTLTYGDQPPRLKARQPQWLDAEQPTQLRPTVPQAVAVQPPFIPLPSWIIESWRELAPPVQRRVNFVPVPPVVDDPPRRDLALLFSIVGRQWEPLPHGAQHGPPLIQPPLTTLIGIWSGEIVIQSPNERIDLDGMNARIDLFVPNERLDI